MTEKRKTLGRIYTHPSGVSATAALLLLLLLLLVLLALLLPFLESPDPEGGVSCLLLRSLGMGVAPRVSFCL